MTIRNDLDWNDLKLLLNLAAVGRVPAAARVLGVDPTTITRRIRRLEKRLEIVVCERVKGGVVFSEVGQQLVDKARAMERELEGLQLASEGARTISGVVRVSTVDYAAYLLATTTERLRRLHPDLVLDFRESYQFQNLAGREVDVAIRFSEYPDPSLVGRRLRPFRVSVYGLEHFVGHKGDGMPWISWNVPQGESANDRWIQSVDPNGRIVSRNSSFLAQSRAAAAGVGVAALPDAYVHASPELQELVKLAEGWDIHAWILTHAELRNVPRIKLVIDQLAEALNRASQSSPEQSGPVRDGQ